MGLHRKKIIRKNRKKTRGGAGTTVKKKPIRSVKISKVPTTTTCKKPTCYACKKVKTINYDKGGVKRIYSPFTLTKLAPSPKPIIKTERRIPPLESHYKSYGLSPKEKMYIISSCQTRTSQYAYLKSLAANAIKNRKIFALYGYCNAVRKALVERGWVEKIPASRMNLSRIRNGIYTSKADIHSELERLLLSNFVEKYSPNFIWTSREEFKDNTIDMTSDYTTIVNKLRIDAMWTTKQGLCSSMKRNYWFYIENVAEVNVPRTYNSYESGEIEGFISDFKITACTSLLKWVLSMVANDRPVFVRSGKIPMNVLLFALNRCKEYLFKKQNKDIDRPVMPVSSGQWNSFLKKYYQIISKAEVFEADKNNQLPLYLGYAKLFLKEILKYRPQLSCEGCHNIWIVKPAHCSRGRGITMASKLGVLSGMLCKATSKYVVQKYIEEPLLIYDTKFDIRQYYLITNTCPLVVWMYRDCYLKFSSQKYNLRNYHESIHLTNNAVQKKYKNCDNRNDELPLNNMWHSDQYKKYLVGVGQEDVWDTVIYPGMRKSIVGVMLNCQDSLSECRHRFELYGCDFILDSKYNPWLIEINSCPDLQHTTPVTAKICPAVVSDIIKGKFLIYIVIDFAKNPNCSTGKFECIYRQPVTIPRYMLSGDLTVRGYSLPTDYFYRGQIEVKESYDNADIGKEKDINKIMKEMKKLYDEDVTLESEPDYLNLNTSKENIIVRDTHFTDSDIDETGGASSCSITEQLGDLLFNITPEKNSEPDGGETVNHLLIDSKYPEVPPKVETVLSKTLSTSKCSRSLIEDKSLDFGPVDDEPMSKVSGWVNPLQRAIHDLSSCATRGLDSTEMQGEIKKMNNMIHSKTESYHSIEQAVANLMNFLKEKEKECRK